MHGASSGGHARCVLALLAAGADPDARAAQGTTALAMAIEQGHAECALLLLRGRASPIGAPNASDAQVKALLASQSALWKRIRYLCSLCALANSAHL